MLAYLCMPSCNVYAFVDLEQSWACVVLPYVDRMLGTAVQAPTSADNCYVNEIRLDNSHANDPIGLFLVISTLTSSAHDVGPECNFQSNHS